MHSSSIFPIFLNFFDFVFFFFINNHRLRYWFHVLSLIMGFSVPCQQVFIKHIVYDPSFWKFKLKYFLTNLLHNPKESISFLVKLLWKLIWMDVFNFQPYIISYLQLLRVSLFPIILLLHCFLCCFHRFCGFFPASL